MLVSLSLKSGQDYHNRGSVDHCRMTDTDPGDAVFFPGSAAPEAGYIIF
ncbi:MAG: hypothetical protein RIC35_05620 [Marinoscillum sp.]